MLNEYGGVPLGKIKGFRAPFCEYLRDYSLKFTNSIVRFSKLYSRHIERNL